MRGMKTGGRRKGVPNKATATRKMLAEAGISAALTTGTSPLEVLLKVMRGGPEASEISDRQFQAAICAAPYIHPRLNTSQVTAHHVMGGLTHEERLERLAALEAGPQLLEGSAEAVREGD